MQIHADTVAMPVQVGSGGGQLCETVINLQPADVLEPPKRSITLEFVITDGHDNWDKPATGEHTPVSPFAHRMICEGSLTPAAMTLVGIARVSKLANSPSLKHPALCRGRPRAGCIIAQTSHQACPA